MNSARALFSVVFLFACQREPLPVPQPPAPKKETVRISDVAASTIALPSSALVAVTGKGLTAFTPSGVLAWTFRLPASDNLAAKPVAAPNSYLYLRGTRTVYAVGPDGKQLWAADVESSPGGPASLVVLTDSSVVAVVGESAITCFTTTGTVRWSYKLPDGARLTAEPTSAPNGFVTLRTKERVYALNSDGQLQWSAVVPPPT